MKTALKVIGTAVKGYILADIICVYLGYSGRLLKTIKVPTGATKFEQVKLATGTIVEDAVYSIEHFFG